MDAPTRLRTLAIVVAVVTDVAAVAQESPAEKKYFLDECGVKIDFHWPSGITQPEKSRVLKDMGERINRAVVSGRFPFFSGHATREANYYVLYFADKCETKLNLAETLVREDLQPNIAGFPPYSVTTNFKIGFDGVMPSGWWKQR